MLQMTAASADRSRLLSIRTERLILEPQSLARFDEWYSMELARDEPGHMDLTEDQAWQRLCSREGTWDAFGIGFYFVLDAANEDLLGEVGFQVRRRGLGAGFDGFPEAAWAISARHQGRGLAFEAMQAVILARDAWTSTGDGRSVALIAEGNAPSVRLASSLGFTIFDQADVGGIPHSLLARDHNSSWDPTPNAA